MTKVVASIEARMGSSRLPGKVLADLGGITVLSLLHKRLRQCRALDGIILATSTSSQDDILEEWARSEEIAIHRGSESDVLQRVVDAPRNMESDIAVGITGDCPFMDPEIVDMSVRNFLKNDCDVLSTKGSFPIGQDTVIYKRSILEDNSNNIFDPLVREHVGYYILQHPELYRTVTIVAPDCWNYPDHRYTLDYSEDLTFLRAIYARLFPSAGDFFTFSDILHIVLNDSRLFDINSMHRIASGSECV